MFDMTPAESREKAEVLKRAGLVLALTAWETYVEDRVLEEVQKRLQVVSGSSIGKFVSDSLDAELKRFHNPGSEKTKRLFETYLGLDVTEHWRWCNDEPDNARATLNRLISKRGDAAHRSKPAGGVTTPHLVTRDDLEKAIRFLKGLVESTENALADV
jgi:hypothetical protein